MAGIEPYAPFVHVLAEVVVIGGAACAGTLHGLMARIRAAGNLLWPHCMPGKLCADLCMC